MSDKIVCTCIGVSEDEIIEAVKSGAHTAEEVGDATQAGTACGACVSEVEELIEANK